MSAGYVYVLTNLAMPDLVKIGMTTKQPKDRAAALSGSSVPYDFEIKGSVFSPDARRLEAGVHEELSGCRVKTGKEFFHVHSDMAVYVINELLSNMFSQESICYARYERAQIIRKKRRQMRDLVRRMVAAHRPSRATPFFSPELLAEMESSS